MWRECGVGFLLGVPLDYLGFYRGKWVMGCGSVNMGWTKAYGLFWEWVCRIQAIWVSWIKT
jgi:hypothetical protein